jgi:hypothetical protein
MYPYSINKTRTLSLGGFFVFYGAALFLFNSTDFDQKIGGVLSNGLGLLLGSFFTGALWVSLQRSTLSDSEKIKLTVGCIFSAVALEFVRASVLTSISNSLKSLPVLLLGHVAVGGFVILGGLHLGHWFVLRKKSIRGKP